MAPKRLQSSVWALAREQHGVVTRAQLIGLGDRSEAMGHRLRGGRLHPVRRGVYAIGRPELSRLGVWMAAVLSCGPRALLSHASAGKLYGAFALEEAALSSYPCPTASCGAGQGSSSTAGADSALMTSRSIERYR